MWPSSGIDSFDSLLTSRDSGQLGSKIARDLVTALGETPDREEVLCRCPICGDSKSDHRKKRFAVNILKGKYFCFNCLSKGGAYEIASLMCSLSDRGDTSAVHDAAPVRRRHIKFELHTEPVHSLWRQKREEILADLCPRQVLSESQILDLDYALPQSRPKKWINRVVFDIDGVKFAKSLDGSQPKYITEPNFKLSERGFPNVRNVDTTRPIIVPEGLMDFLSLPKNNAVLAPGTAALSGDDMLNLLNIATSGLIIVPDYDAAGVKAFLRVVNKRPPHLVRVFFPGMLDRSVHDLNDLKLNGFTHEELYDIVVGESLDLLEALARVIKEYPIIKKNGVYKLLDGDSHERNIITNKVKRPGIGNRAKERPITRVNQRRDRPTGRRSRNLARQVQWF